MVDSVYYDLHVNLHDWMFLCKSCIYDDVQFGRLIFSTVDCHLSMYRHPCPLGSNRTVEMLVTKDITITLVHELRV